MTFIKALKFQILNCKWKIVKNMTFIKALKFQILNCKWKIVKNYDSY
jgi:hypothetical protein